MIIPLFVILIILLGINIYEYTILRENIAFNIIKSFNLSNYYLINRIEKEIMFPANILNIISVLNNSCRLCNKKGVYCNVCYNYTLLIKNINISEESLKKFLDNVKENILLRNYIIKEIDTFYKKELKNSIENNYKFAKRLLKSIGMEEKLNKYFNINVCLEAIDNLSILNENSIKNVKEKCLIK